jgi:hypothetical protein
VREPTAILPTVASRRFAAFGHALDAVVAASAAPYGYTISIWSSGAIVMHAHGAPDVLDVVLFALGALVGFAALGLASTAIAACTAATLDRGSERVAAGMLNLLAVGAALGSAVVLARTPGRLAWLLASLAATALYLLAASAQLALVDRRARRHRLGHHAGPDVD